MDVKEEDILGEDACEHWYYRAKADAVMHALGPGARKTLFDVGAGSGVFSKYLLEADMAHEAWCIDPAYEQEREETHAGQPLRFRHAAPDIAPDLIMMMDVLEHVEDDAGLLRPYANQLKPGGEILITVPAFQSLWSGHDVFLEHFRRYRREEVNALIERCGLSVQFSRYFFGGLFPFVYLKRRFDAAKIAAGDETPSSNLARAPGWLNHALIRAHHIERTLLYPFNKLAGVSIVCVAKKLSD